MGEKPKNYSREAEKDRKQEKISPRVLLARTLNEWGQDKVKNKQTNEQRVNEQICHPIFPELFVICVLPPLLQSGMQKV